MPKTSETQAPYFQHDYAAQTDKKIKKLILDMGFEGYGLFWSIVELMHRDELKVGEEYLVCGTELESKVKKILTEFELFEITDGYYVSKRIIRNIEKQEQTAEKSKVAANTRWLLSAYCKKYKEEFGTTLSLSKEEKSKIIELDKEIEGFREKLEDIFYTAHKMQPFDNGVRADSSWLLKKNNLREILNGHYGPLKHKPKNKDNEEAKEEIKPDSLSAEIKQIKDRDTAIKYLNERVTNTAFIMPQYKSLMKKFNIKAAELNKGNEAKSKAPPDE